MTAQQQQIPEALGPGIEDGAGGVIYGPEAQRRGAPQIYIEPRSNPAGQAAAPWRCAHCADIPDELLAALSQALDEAGKKARR
jgi:hypothetical protein